MQDRPVPGAIPDSPHSRSFVLLCSVAALERGVLQVCIISPHNYSPTFPLLHSPTHYPFTIHPLSSHSPTYSLTHSLTYSLTHSLTHPPIHSLTHSLNHRLTQSPTHPLIYCSRCSTCKHCCVTSVQTEPQDRDKPAESAEPPPAGRPPPTC
jgi:hypothetical protein